MKKKLNVFSGINLVGNVRIALRALRSNMLRSSLTVLGIVIGVAAVVALLSIGKGATANITDRVASMAWVTNLQVIKMNNPLKVESIKSIRSRLLRIVLRAFAIVVVITIISILGITIYEINNSARQNPFYRSPSTMLLEAFYVGNGGWNNVDKLVQEAQKPDSQYPAQDWNNSLILDANDTVILDHAALPRTQYVYPYSGEYLCP